LIDRTMIGRVISNLLHNAIQAMDGQGKLSIRVKNTGTYAIVSITDTGSGVAPEIMDRIFEPFFTTKPLGEGSGLGLDIVRKMVEKHSGTIRVKSEPGNTTFIVRIPLLPK